MAKPKKIDIIAKIYNGIIKGIAIGKTLVALQGSARAGKSFQIMIFLIQCALEPNIVNKLNMANYISRLKAWRDRMDKIEGESEPQQPVTLEKVHISVVRLAMPSIKRSIFRDFVEIMNLMGIYDPRRMNKTEMIYTFENGSIIEFFATADNEQKVRGSKRDILFINEANEVSEWEFTQLRMRSMSFSIVDFNPSFTEEHWLFKKLDDPRTYHFVSTFIDNPFLPDAVKEEIMSYKYTNPALWKIFGLGEFAIVEGLVYPKETWDVVELTDLPIDVKVEKRIGIDIGFSGKGDPTAAVLCYYANINGIKHMWMEELVYDKGLNEKQLAFRLKPYNHIKKYIDSANPLYIQNLEDSGMSLVYPVVKYANSVVDGINKVQGYKLHVIKGSVNIIKELNNYCWMKDRHEAFTNTPIDKFNHAMDAMRYSTMSDRAGRATKKRYTKDELNFGF
jgi:phage terminase large subunit